MGHIRALWRLFRVAFFELPIFILLGVAALAAALNIDGEIFGNILTWIVVGLGLLLILAFVIALLPRPRNTYGAASFATSQDIRRAKLRKRGVLLGKVGGRTIRFSGPGHALTFAPTRSGKGVSAVIPNLLDHPGSVVVTDIKGENYRITADYRGTIGRVLALAPFDPNIGNATFNPLDFIRKGTPHEVDDARLMAEMIVVSNGPEPNHWEREARMLIAGLLLFMVTGLPEKQRNLAYLRHILMSSREVFDSYMELMEESDHPSVFRIACGFSQKEERERASVISTAQGSTEVFESPQLAKTTASSSFSFEQLKDGVTSVYVVIPPEYVKVYQPFLRLIVGLATAAMSRNAKVPKHPVLFLLDELPALGYMRPIEDGIGYLAGYGAVLWLFVQDLDQLKQTYSKWRSMIANCAVRQAFNVQDNETAGLLSAMLGQRTVKTKSSGTAGRWGWLGIPSSFSSNSSETGRPLLSPDEIMLLPASCELLFVQSCKPILAEKLRYYKDRPFSWRATQPSSHY